MPIKDMATSTATFGFIRSGLPYSFPRCAATDIEFSRLLGGTIGITVGDAILSGVRPNV